jgi:phage replication O-like protein O
MANGLANGYTRIAHKIMEDIIKYDFTKRGYKILLWVLRNGYGFSQEQSACKLNIKKIVHDTGIERSNVWKTLRLLERKNILVLENKEIRFIRHSAKWDMVKTTTKNVRLKQPQTTVKTTTNYGQNNHANSSNTLTDSDLPSPKENTKENRNPHTPTSGGLSIDDSFNQIWKIYPKKVSKAAAKKAFQKIKPNKELFDTMIKAIETHSSSRDWTKENGQYIPHLSTWLNNKRWEDELVTTVQTGFGFGNNEIKQEGY